MDLIFKEQQKIHITPREIQVIELLAEGKTNAEIGEILFISFHTVKAILEKIYEKTGCANRVQVAVFAIKNNLI